MRRESIADLWPLHQTTRADAEKLLDVRVWVARQTDILRTVQGGQVRAKYGNGVEEVVIYVPAHYVNAVQTLLRKLMYLREAVKTAYNLGITSASEQAKTTFAIMLDSFERNLIFHQRVWVDFVIDVERYFYKGKAHTMSPLRTKGMLRFESTVMRVWMYQEYYIGSHDPQAIDRNKNDIDWIQDCLKLGETCIYPRSLMLFTAICIDVSRCNPVPDWHNEDIPSAVVRSALRLSMLAVLEGDATVVPVLLCNTWNSLRLLIKLHRYHLLLIYHVRQRPRQRRRRWQASQIERRRRRESRSRRLAGPINRFVFRHHGRRENDSIVNQEDIDETMEDDIKQGDDGGQPEIAVDFLIPLMLLLLIGLTWRKGHA
jgi:hypothetical protein